MAVYTHVTDAELTTFLETFDLGQALSFKGIAEGIQNSNFLLKTETGRYILTLYETRVEEQSLPFFLTLIDHLSKSGITCPTPIHDKLGNSLSECAGRPAAIFTFLDGMSINQPQPNHCSALGSEMATMHIAGQSFDQSRSNDFSPLGMQKYFKKIIGDIETISPGLYSLIENELSYLIASWPSGLPQGIIHADLFPDNVFFLREKISGLIDFYFACTDFLALDLAISLNAWCFNEDNTYNPEKAMALISAYNETRQLTNAELNAFPVLARAASMRFLLTRTNDWLQPTDGALVERKNPLEYIEKLKFHQSAKDVSCYGIR